MPVKKINDQKSFAKMKCKVNINEYKSVLTSMAFSDIYFIFWFLEN